MANLDFGFNIGELSDKCRRGWGVYFGDMRFPVTPESIKVKIKSNNKTINLINEGEVNIIKSPGLTSVTFGVLLPQQIYPFALYNHGFKKADYYLSELEFFKTCGKPFTFRIIRYVENSFELLYHTEMKATLEDYNIIEDAQKYGSDVFVEITLLQYRSFSGKEIKLNAETNTATEETVREKEDKNTVEEYTVKAGDTLSTIAKALYGWEEYWKNLYDENKEVIEQKAKENGRESSSNGAFLYEGTVLKIPKVSG